MNASVAILWMLVLCLVLPNPEPTLAKPSIDPVSDFGTAPAAPTSTPAPAASRPTPSRSLAASATLPASMTALPTGGKVAIIPISGLIYDFTIESFEQRAQRAIDDGAAVIVIELDTPGGVLTSAIQLSRRIKQLPVPTVAWVHDQAYSAGTLVAAACQFIVMSPRSSLGDCAPIIPGQNLSSTERAKALSPLLEEFRDSALANGYDYALFEAMCQLGVELYLIEHPPTGQRRVVGAADHRWMVHGIDTQASGPTAALNQPDTTDPSLSDDPVLAEPSGRRVGTDADQGQWILVTQTPTLGPTVQPIHDGRTLLTLSQDRALDYGLSQGIVRSDAELQALFGASTIGRYQPTLWQGIAYWLTRPWARALLLMVVFVGFYLEIQAPGLSLPGLVAIIALVLLLGAPFLVGLAQWWHLLLFLLGLALLIVELFVTPGFGLMGISGLVAMFAALALSVVPTAGGGLPARETLSQLQWSALSMIAGGAVGLVILIMTLRQFNRIPGLNRLVLQDAQPATVLENIPAPQEPVPAPQEPVPAAQPRDLSSDQSEKGVRVGDLGTVVAQLRPTGQAEFAGRYVDVTSRGDWIDVGTTVRVVAIQGMLVWVEPATDPRPGSNV